MYRSTKNDRHDNQEPQKQQLPILTISESEQAFYSAWHTFEYPTTWY